MNAPTAAKRSATHGPPYSSAAASANGAKSISVSSQPSAAARRRPSCHAAAACASPPNVSPSGRGTPIRAPGAGGGRRAAVAGGAPRASTDRPGRGPPATARTRAASRDVGRQQRDAVQAAAGGHDAARRRPAERGLQPDDGVERRRHAARAGRVRAERERDGAVGDGDRRARARSAGDVARVGDARARAVGRPRSGQAGRELVHVRLADRDRARRDEALDDERAAVRGVGKRRARRGRRQARDVDVVLDREGHAVERQVGRRAARSCASHDRTSLHGASEIHAGPAADCARS